MTNTIATIEAQLHRLARYMNELDLQHPADRAEFLTLCHERQALQRQRWALLRSTSADAWADAWEDGRPADAPRTASSTRPALGWLPGGQDAAQGHQRPATSALDAPAWPDAPTEETTHPEETTHA
jgi:hypothetical protein